MKIAITISSVLLLIAFQALAATPSAEKLLAQAKVTAVAEHKAIFVHFGASWCGWYKRLEAILERAHNKLVCEKYFVPVKLVVQEKEKNKELESPGAETLLKQVGGPAGLPYSAFLNAKGDLIVNSDRNGEK